MERLTVNKNISEMSIVELAHNCCYVKENEARYRDYDMSINARELTIKLLDRFADVPNEFICDEDFDDFMLDSLQYGTDNILGLIALFYRDLWAMADLHERLKEYEDLEEQGLLRKLPFTIGSDVYFIPSKVNFDLNKLNQHEENNKVYHQKVAIFVLTKHGWYLECDKDLEYGTGHILVDELYKKTWFFTQAEAEEALKKMESEG